MRDGYVASAAAYAPFHQSPVARGRPIGYETYQSVPDRRRASGPRTLLPHQQMGAPQQYGNDRNMRQASPFRYAAYEGSVQHGYPPNYEREDLRSRKPPQAEFQMGGSISNQEHIMKPMTNSPKGGNRNSQHTKE